MENEELSGVSLMPENAAEEVKKLVSEELKPEELSVNDEENVARDMGKLLLSLANRIEKTKEHLNPIKSAVNEVEDTTSMFIEKRKIHQTEVAALRTLLFVILIALTGIVLGRLSSGRDI